MEFENLLWKEPRLELTKSTIGANPSDDSHLAIEMSLFESAFVCGLIRKYRPAKIVEIGVSAGGTSALILKAASMLGLECKLHSIDIFINYVRDTSKQMGYVVKEFTPELVENWNLYLGKVASAPLKRIGPGIDLCIIDTQHIIPGEILDFIAVYPYLSENAIVILHDMARQFDPEYGQNFHRHATTALFSCVTAEKLVLSDILNERPEGLPNIAAFKVNSDTKKYISNLFLALSLPWTYLPAPEHVADYLDGMYKFYSLDLIEYFKRALNVNFRMRKAHNLYSIDKKKDILLDSISN
jgi:predicted O-methyltransferase YrrM